MASSRAVAASWLWRWLSASRVPGGCAGHFALHHAQLVGQHFGFGLYFIPHNAGNFIGLVLGGVLLAAAQQKQNQQHIGQYRQQQKNNQ